MAKQQPAKGSYTLYYSDAQRAMNEADQITALQITGVRYDGSYIFYDQQTSKRYEATEFVADRYVLGIRFQGKPTFKDAKLVAAYVPAANLRRLPRELIPPK